MSQSYSFAATLVSFVTRAGEFAYPHDHPYPPTDAFVVYRSGSAVLSRTTTDWTADTISLTSSAAGTIVTLLLFGQEAETLSLKTGYITLLRRTSAGQVAEFLDGATNEIVGSFPVPTDWSAGTGITVKLLHSNTVGSNTVAFRRDSFRNRDGTAISTIESAVNIDIAVADTNTHLLTWNVAVANYAVGDAVVFVYRRLGADASDTNTGNMQAVFWFEYQTA